MSTKGSLLRYVFMDYSCCICLNLTTLSGSSMFLQLSAIQSVIVLDLHKLDLAFLIIQEKYIIMVGPVTAVS